jgi:hypothetical protein
MQPRPGVGVVAILAHSLQDARYGDDWFTGAARLDILQEMLLCQSPKTHFTDAQVQDIRLLLNRRSETGRAADITAINTLLNHAADSTPAQKPLAVRTLAWMQQQQHYIQPDQTTYRNLLYLCLRLRALDCVRLVFFYGVLSRKLDANARMLLKQYLLGYIPGEMAAPKLRLFPKMVEEKARRSGVPKAYNAASALERYILDNSKFDGYELVRSLPEAMLLALGPDPYEGSGLSSGNSDSDSDTDIHSDGNPTERRRWSRERCILVPMRCEAGERPDKNVVLDSKFDPLAMIHARLDPAERRARSQYL